MKRKRYLCSVLRNVILYRNERFCENVNQFKWFICHLCKCMVRLQCYCRSFHSYWRTFSWRYKGCDIYAHSWALFSTQQTLMLAHQPNQMVIMPTVEKHYLDEWICFTQLLQADLAASLHLYWHHNRNRWFLYCRWRAHAQSIRLMTVFH